MIINQKTIKEPVTVSGIGIHTGENIKVTLFPAECNTGIIFKRIDIPGTPTIKAHYKNVFNSKREVTLQKDNIEIHTVEHLLSCLSAFGISNLIVELNGPELPIGDGSAIHFIEILKRAGICEQNEKQKTLICKSPVYINDGDKYLIALPSDKFRINFTVDYKEPISTQYSAFTINEETFTQEISRARTFGFLHEVKELWASKLAQGGSLDNAIVIGENNIINGELHYNNELARHKIMDLLGDLYLLSMPILADIIAIKSGHYMNIQLVNQLSQFIE